MITFHVITIFPEMFDSYLHESVLKRAAKQKNVEFKFYNPRDFATDKHHTVDDRPYGGGPGMVMKAEPIMKAVRKARGRKKNVKVILFAPGGAQFTNAYADKLLEEYTDIILVAGRYEGIDARVIRMLKSEALASQKLQQGERNSKSKMSVEEVSVGPYVLTGGELPAMIVIDVVTRRIPGVLGNAYSVEERRTASQEVYTRPEVLLSQGKKYRVPKTLVSGHHEDIHAWRDKRKRKSLP